MKRNTCTKKLSSEFPSMGSCLTKTLSMMLASMLFAAGPAAADVSHRSDLDGDGKPDEIIVEQAPLPQDVGATARVTVKLSSRKTPINVVLNSDTSSLDVYPGRTDLRGRTLIVDRSERNSREAPEFDYSVYQWSSASDNFCLHAIVTGVPPNQLRGETIPSDVEVIRYAPCTALGDDDGKGRKLTPDDARRQAVEELKTIDQHRQIPEYLVWDLASQVDSDNVRMINDAGYYQEQAGLLDDALVLLRAVHRAFPRRLVAQLNLADTYWKQGNKKSACKLYASYLAATKQSKYVPERVAERANCSR